MATLTVSNAAQLRSAINSASQGDTIRLADGSYGDVSLKGVENLTLTAAGSNAVLSELDVRNADGLTLDGLTLEGRTDGAGYGTGTAIEIKASSDVTLTNTEISDYAKGVRVWDASGLTISNNSIDNISIDGIVLGHVQNTRVTGNDVTMHGREAVDHKDAIQVYNQGDKAPTSNLTIADNTLTAEDGNIHGIYMGNADAARGGRSEYYSDITITGNVIDVQHKLGIAVGQTDGLTITDNVVLQNDGANGARAINTPLILVQQDSDNVRISGNTVLDTPAAAGSNWQQSGGAGGWSISGNSTVSVSTSVSNYQTASGAGSDAGSGSGSDSGIVTSPTTGAGDAGSAESFRFAGSWIDGDTKASFADVDFGAGDVLKLGRYDADTFGDLRGGNIVENSKDGSYVKIDSLTDIAELDAHSHAVSAHVTGDDLTVTITQESGTLDLVLAGLGQEYQNSYDDTLF